jgi:hypothetical protein
MSRLVAAGIRATLRLSHMKLLNQYEASELGQRFAALHEASESGRPGFTVPDEGHSVGLVSPFFMRTAMISGCSGISKRRNDTELT